jgi:hypothetical protein
MARNLLTGLSLVKVRQLSDYNKLGNDFGDENKISGDYNKFEANESETSENCIAKTLPIRKFWSRLGQLSYDYHANLISILVTIAVILLITIAALFQNFLFPVENQQGKHGDLRPLYGSVDMAEDFLEWIECVTTASEARSLGCVFDLMLSSWIHESCFDGDMMDQYLEQENHRYFPDENMTEKMPEEEARRGDYPRL